MNLSAFGILNTLVPGFMECIPVVDARYVWVLCFRNLTKQILIELSKEDLV